MSTQETKLKAIADAIREKDGTTEPIPASEFPERIRAIETGGTSSYAIPLTVTVETGAVVTAVNGEDIVSSVADESGTAVLILTAPGEWTVTAALDGKEKSVTVEAIDGYAEQFRLSSRLPGGYTEVEYIVIPCAYEAIISTDVTINFSSTRFVLDALLQRTSNAGTNSVFIVGTPYKQSYVFSVSINSSNKYCYSFRDAGLKTTSVSPNGRTVIDVNFQNKILKIGELEIILSVSSGVGNKIQFGSAGGYSARMEIYSSQIYDGNTLVRDFVPCTDPSGAVGLYDLVEGKFYGNAGTGAFEAGPAV